MAKKSDEWGDPGYVVDVNNKSDKSIYVTVPSDACSVNGKMVDFWGGDVRHDWDWWFIQASYFLPKILNY